MPNLSIAYHLSRHRSEAALEERVKKFCNSRSLLCYKFVSPANKGVPDRIICGRGKVLFLELKSEGGSLTRKQQYELEKLRGAGMEAYWSNNYGHIVDLLNDFFSLGEKREVAAPKELPSDALERLNALYHNPGGS